MDSISLYSLLGVPRHPVLRARDPVDTALRDLMSPFCSNLGRTNPMHISHILEDALQLSQEDIDNVSDDNENEVDALSSASRAARRLPPQGSQLAYAPYRHDHQPHHEQRRPMDQ
jgi:hypothetical protein